MKWYTFAKIGVFLLQSRTSEDLHWDLYWNITKSSNKQAFICFYFTIWFLNSQRTQDIQRKNLRNIFFHKNYNFSKNPCSTQLHNKSLHQAYKLSPPLSILLGIGNMAFRAFQAVPFKYSINIWFDPFKNLAFLCCWITNFNYQVSLAEILS